MMGWAMKPEFLGWFRKPHLTKWHRAYWAKDGNHQWTGCGIDITGDLNTMSFRTVGYDNGPPEDEYGFCKTCQKRKNG